MKVNIEGCLNDLATAYGWDTQALIGYTFEDTVGGWEPATEPERRPWPLGSIWAIEGRILYSLIRYLKPEYAVEIGTFHGCSALHIITAMKKNGKGKLFCVDNGVGGAAPGDWLTKWAPDYIEFIHGDGGEWLASDPVASQVGFVFEDGDHSADLCERVWRAAKNIAPGGIIVSHDAMHFLVGNAVRQGIINSGVPNPRFYLIEPADCGLGIGRIPERETPKVEEVQTVRLDPPLEMAAPIPPPKSKRKRGRPRKRLSEEDIVKQTNK